MYHSGKIGVFVSHIMGHYQTEVCQGILDTAGEYGYTTEFFTTLDGEELGDYSRGEESILSLPDYDGYSGMIFASETYPSARLRAQILASLKERCRCPVTEIAVTDQQFPAVALDNDSMFGELAAHLIRRHGCRRICYLGSRRQSYFSDHREQCCRRALADAGLAMTDADVRACEPSPDAVREAVSSLLSSGERPDAIVCYNDELALLAVQALHAAGLSVPADIAVTGCDHTPEGQHALPTLTTVSFPVYELGRRATEVLLAQIRGREVPAVSRVLAEPVYGTSCGCPAARTPDAFAFQQRQSGRIASLESSILGSMRMSAALSRISDLDEGMDLLESYIRGIEHCREFYLCLYEGWDSVSSYVQELTGETESDADSGRILLKLAVRDGRRLPECSFTHAAPHGLLPEHICRDSGSCYLYTPLFFEDRVFGYAALSYEQNRINYHFQLVHWFLNINQWLHGLCETKCNALLLRHLEDVYTKDPLTGLLNKHGYLRRAEALLRDARAAKKPVACFLFDLDRLKQINDSYGHAEGDFAIRVIGEALQHAARENDICARFSGDEFYLLAADCTPNDAKALLSRVDRYLENYNLLSTKAYSVLASGGFAVADGGSVSALEDLDALFEEADRNMYLTKQAHHASAG